MTGSRGRLANSGWKVFILRVFFASQVGSFGFPNFVFASMSLPQGDKLMIEDMVFIKFDVLDQTLKSNSAC